MARRNRGAGFTLIETMIAVSIIGILATIAIPRFMQYQLKVKTAEARTMLGGIITSQEAFRAEFEDYAHISTPNPPTPPGLTKQTWPDVACPSACNRENPSACDSFNCIGFEPPSVVYFQYAAPHMPRTSAGVPPEFAAGAAADLDGDGIVGSYAFRSGNYGGSVGLIGDGITTCPANIPIRHLMQCSPIHY